MKKCKKCNEEKEESEYRKNIVNGKIYIGNICRGCRNTANNEYMKKIYYQKNKEKIKKYQNNYRKENNEKLKEYFAKNYKHNREEKLKYSKSYQTEHKQQRNLKEKMKKETNCVYRLKCTIRKTLNSSFKRKKYSKKNDFESIIGLNINDFIRYLLLTFKNNYGYEWDGIEKVHIDHITPLATAKTEEEVIKLCRYSNLQLLKAEDNLRKGAKLEF